MKNSNKKNKSIKMVVLALMVLLMGCGTTNSSGQAQQETISQENFSLKEDEMPEAESAEETLSEGESERESLSEGEISEVEAAKDSLPEEETLEEKSAEAALTESETLKAEASNEALSENEVETEAAKVALSADDNREELIATLQLAQSASQLVVVSVENGNATLYLYEKDTSGSWSTLVEADATIGKNGIGKTKEGDRKTPRGAYTMSLAFGNKENPGTSLPYTQTDSSWYWVDDVNSAYYNRFVSTNEVTADWNSAEHIAAVRNSYNYAIAIDYNTVCAKGAGSAIFLHCKPSGGAGCVAIDEDKMLTVIRNIQPGCYIIIDDAENIKSY